MSACMPLFRCPTGCVAVGKLPISYTNCKFIAPHSSFEGDFHMLSLSFSRNACCWLLVASNLLSHATIWVSFGDLGFTFCLLEAKPFPTSFHFGLASHGINQCQTGITMRNLVHDNHLFNCNSRQEKKKKHTQINKLGCRPKVLNCSFWTVDNSRPLVDNQNDTFMHFS